MANSAANLKSSEELARQGLNDAWNEIKLGPADQPPHPNYTKAAKCLQQAEEAFVKGNYGQSLMHTTQGRDAAVKARLAVGRFSKVVGFLIVGLLLVYFWGAAKALFDLQYTCCQPTSTIADASMAVTPAPVVENLAPGSGIQLPEVGAVSTPKLTPVVEIPTSAATVQPSDRAGTATLSQSPTSIITPTLPSCPAVPITFFWLATYNIPCDEGKAGIQTGIDARILLWGFLGGVVWCMYSLGYYFSRRLFDWHYVVWYILNPWLAAALGGTFTLAVMSGLVGIISKVIGDTTTIGSQAFLNLVSFVAGLATHDFLNLLIRIVTAVFDRVGTDAQSASKAK
jgi:hypothetical protein